MNDVRFSQTSEMFSEQQRVEQQRIEPRVHSIDRFKDPSAPSAWGVQKQLLAKYAFNVKTIWADGLNAYWTEEDENEIPLHLYNKMYGRNRT